MTTKKVYWGLGREIIDFEENLTKTHWGVKKYESHERLYVRELHGDLEQDL